MRARTPGFLLAVVGLAAALACSRGEGTPAATPPSPATPTAGIVLVTVEGWGDPKPGADPFAAETLPGAVRVADALTVCPQVRPAVAAILTGSAPDRSGVRDDLSGHLAADAPFLPALFSAAGWQTGAFVANPAVGIGSGLERGFDVFDVSRQMLFGPQRFIPPVRPPEEVVANFASWSASLDPSRRFFAWVHLAGTDKGLGETWKGLAGKLAGEGRLKDATVLLVGTSGRIDTAGGENSGYFLTADVLRVPLLYRARAAASGGVAIAAGAPVSLVDVAAVLARDAGIALAAPDGAVPEGAGDPSRPRFAFTWRGAREMGWPVEAAVSRGGSLLVVKSGDPMPAPDPWSGRPAWDEPRRTPPPTLSPEVKASLASAGVAVPQAKSLGPPAPRATRAAAIAPMNDARRLALTQHVPEAVAAFDVATKRDPGNLGALVEKGGLLAMVGRYKLATSSLEEALRIDPYRADTWHWVGHAAYAEKNFAKAEAAWRMSDAIRPRDPDVLYDLACARSLAKDLDGSEAFLRRAWQAGFRMADQLQSDPDLRNLREDPRFSRLMSEIVR